MPPKEKLESEKIIAEKAAASRGSTLRARRRFRLIKSSKMLFSSRNGKRKARYDSQLKNMNDLYARHGDEWVDTIVKRVLED